MKERLRLARLDAGFTNASEFARLLDVVPVTVYRLESTKYPAVPSVETLRRWAELCGCTADYLLGLSPRRRAA